MVLLSPNQQRRVDEITEIQKTVGHVRTLVAELESNRAAKTTIVTNLCSTIARELSQMRQRLLTTPIGTIADIAGALSIMASRTGGLNMKLRGRHAAIRQSAAPHRVERRAARRHDRRHVRRPADGAPGRRRSLGGCELRGRAENLSLAVSYGLTVTVPCIDAWYVQW